MRSKDVCASERSCGRFFLFLVALSVGLACANSRGPARPRRANLCQSDHVPGTIWSLPRTCHLLTRRIHSRTINATTATQASVPGHGCGGNAPPRPHRPCVLIFNVAQGDELQDAATGLEVINATTSIFGEFGLTPPLVDGFRRSRICIGFGVSRKLKL